MAKKRKILLPSKIEDTLVKELAVQLKPNAKRIWTHKKPSVSKPYRERLEERLSYIPILQPEIDLCVLTHSDHFLVVEAKLFKGDITYKTPFYEEIGQALALHRYGFDAVALWFLFSDGVNLEGVNRYGAEAWTFVRKDLKLPLDFSYITVRKEKHGHIFDVMQYENRQHGFRILYPINHDNFVLKWRHQNPILDLPVQRTMRETLEWWLQI